ncbi:MAG: thiamine biosynthesis lipoprotein [Bacillota bacterium]|jgi:thiamine biosynthesis lipoprotein ApbE
MKPLFLWFKNTFSFKERLVLIISTLLSALILSTLLWVRPFEQGVNPYQLLAYNIDVRDRNQTKLDPFYTIFFANYEAKAPLEEKEEVIQILTEEVQRLHPYADRHHDFIDGELQTIQNLKVLNASMGTDQWIPIDDVFYELLSEAKLMTIFTDGAFNMFMGAISDYWDALLENPYYRLFYRELDPAYQPLQRLALEHLLQFVPMSPEGIDETLELKIEAGQAYAKFNGYHGAQTGELKITLGAIAKGFANDVIADRLGDLGYTRGYISNGTSSITTLGQRYGNTPYRWQVASPHPSAAFAFSIEKAGRHSLSTSGAYNGFSMPLGSEKILRHHIIDPQTGYPSKPAIELNVISETYPAGRLDALSTAMMTMTKSEAMALRLEIIEQGYDLEIAWVEVNHDQVEVYYSRGYEVMLIKDNDVKYKVL